jgi:hypothetical protein
MAMSPLATALLLAIGAMSAFAQLGNLQICPAGQTGFNGRCYKVYKSSADCGRDFSFDEANAFCRANGGQLASIHSAAQNDFIKSLITRSQSKCEKRDILYWIGLQLTHGVNQRVSGSSWTDGSVVDYGNPLNPPFQPPFVEGAPKGAGVDEDDSEVCPPGNERNCVQIFGYGSDVGRWTDANCSKVHYTADRCAIAASSAIHNGIGGKNGTKGHHKRHHSDSESSSEEEDGADDTTAAYCRAQAASNGFICKFCPAGFTYWQGNCYITIPQPNTFAGYNQICQGLNASIASIHSAEENEFIATFAAANGGFGALATGLTIAHSSGAPFAPVTSAVWSDDSTVDFGNPMVTPWSAGGVYPWADSNNSPQPDNRPPPGNRVIMWLPGAAAGLVPGTWDDLVDDASLTPLFAAVCKLKF